VSSTVLPDKLDGRIIYLHEKINLRKFGERTMIPSYLFIPLVLVVVVVSFVVWIKLMRKQRRPQLPLPRHPAPRPVGEDSSTSPTRNPVVLAAIITAIASIIVALIGAVTK
jgi:hypothetical protein